MDLKEKRLSIQGKPYLSANRRRKSSNEPRPLLLRFILCFTGKLERMTRKEANKAAALVGGIPEKGVTKHTNILVVGEQD